MNFPEDAVNGFISLLFDNALPSPRFHPLFLNIKDIRANDCTLFEIPQ